MSGRTTLALFVTLAVLCFGYWLMVRLEEKDSVEQLEARKLFDFDADVVTTIEIHRVGEEPSAATRGKGKSWVMTKPHPTIEPNQVVWDRAAAAFADLVNERTIQAEPSDLAKYGLDEPMLRFRASVSGGTEIELAFGGIEPTQTYRYAHQKGGLVFLASVKAFHELDRPLNMLRYPYIVNVGEEGITRIEFARIWTGRDDTSAEDPADKAASEPGAERVIGEESVVVGVRRPGNGPWRMYSPYDAAANQKLVEELARRIQFATSQRFIDDPESLDDYGLDPPRARLTVYSGADAKPWTLYLGSRESLSPEGGPAQGGLFVKHEAKPTVMVIDPQIGDLLPKTPSALREKRLFTHQVSDIATLEYASADGERFTLENDPDRGWRFAQPEGLESDQAAVSSFMMGLKALEGRGFPGDPQPQFGLDTPAITLKFAFKDDAPPATILVGAEMPDAEKYYATQDTGVVTLLSNLDLRILRKTAFDFRLRKLMRFDQAIRLELAFDGTDYLFERPRGKWVLTRPEGRTLGNQSDVQSLVEALGSAHAVAIEAKAIPSGLAAYGLDVPLATITVTAPPQEDASGNATIEPVFGPLKIGTTAPDNSQQRFALLEGQQEVFRVKQAIVDEIRETLKGIE